MIELIQAGGWLMLPILLFWPTAAAFRLTGHGNRGEGMREQRKPQQAPLHWNRSGTTAASFM